MKSASFATACLIALLGGTHAAPVNFTAAALSDVNQITTAGTLVEAVNLGAGATDVTVNTVVFAGGAGANLAIQAATSDYNADKFNSSAPNRVITGLLPADGDSLLDPFAFGSGVGSDLVTLSGLTIGLTYEIQLLIVEDRDTTSAVRNRTVTVSEVDGDADAGTGRLDFSYDTDTDGSAVQLVTGTFTADAATQTFDISQLDDGNAASPNNAQINAYQLRVSPLRVVAFSFDATAGESELTFTSSPGIAYQIWHNADLDPGGWTKIQDVTGADAPSIETTTIIPEALYSGPVDRAFFRVASAVFIPAVITFTAADFLDEAQISTAGSLVEAVNFGTGSTDQNLNGITFTATGASSANLAVQAGTANTFPEKYDDAIHTITGVDAAEGNALFDAFVFGSGEGSNLITLSGLTVGVQYEFQILFVDDRTTNSIPTRTITVSQADGGTPAVGPLDHTSSNVQLVTGTFTANATTQLFDISTSVGDNALISAYQLRAINP